MYDRRPVTRNMLVGAIELDVDTVDLPLEEAMRMADVRAMEVMEQPMLLAWFSKKTGRHSPAIC